MCIAPVMARKCRLSWLQQRSFKRQSNCFVNKLVLRSVFGSKDGYVETNKINKELHTLLMTPRPLLSSIFSSFSYWTLTVCALQIHFSVLEVAFLTPHRNCGCSHLCVWISKQTSTSDLSAEFYVLLTVHLVMILGKWPTWPTFLFCVFISILYMFRATSCSSSGESIVSIQHMVYVTLCRWPFRVQSIHEDSVLCGCTITDFL
jgi:hypothetical protein